MNYELEGKTALVTGASRGLGEKVSLGLIQKGTHVIGASRSGPPKSLKEHIERGKASYESGDLSTDWESIIEKIYEEHGGFEIFVNNAGALSTDYFARLDPNKIASEINLDLVVPILMHRSWLGLYNERSNAKTPELSINLCSISSIYSWPGGTAYQVSKTGLAAFVWAARSMQRNLQENADRETKNKLGKVSELKTRFVAIYPDSVDTGMIARAEQNSLYKVKGDLLPQDIVIETVMKSIEGVGNYGRYDDIAILANPTDPQSHEVLRGIYAAFLPLDEETNRPAFNQRVLEKIAGEERLIKK